MAGKRQTTQSPDSFAFRRRSCSWRRCYSLRSGEVFPFRSCSNGSRSLASTSVVAGSGQGFVCWAFGSAFRGGGLVELFRGGFPDGFVLVGGRPPSLLGPGNGNVNSKVRPTARRGGACCIWTARTPPCSGSSPPLRGQTDGRWYRLVKSQYHFGRLGPFGVHGQWDPIDHGALAGLNPDALDEPVEHLFPVFGR